MRIAVTGATGSIGGHLVLRLRAAGHEVVAITRDAEAARGRLPEGVEVREVDTYDSRAVGPAIAGCDAVVHFAGEPIFGKRWRKRQKKVVYASRVVTTRAIVQAIHDSKARPKTFVCASAVGFYGPRDPDEVLDEDAVDAADHAPRDFLAWVCRDWEDAALDAEREGVRTVILRTGVVLMKGAGILGRLERPFRMCLGGPIGSGRQAFSWIHVDDLTNLALFALSRPVSGVLNAVSPNPVTNKEFSSALGRALGRPAFLPMPGFALRVLLGGVASVATTGQRVVPKRALDLGFAFRHPTIDEALASIEGADEAKVHEGATTAS